MLVRSVSLDDLHARHYAITPAVGENYAQAARVCLDRHHASPVEFTIEYSGGQEQVIVKWDRADERARAAWANRDDATRDGAYALALAAVEAVTGLVAVSRAETKTGADYFLALPGSDVEDLEHTVRLEISGTDSGRPADISRRLKEKLEQAASGASDLPAMAAVVGFKARIIAIAHLVKP